MRRVLSISIAVAVTVISYSNVATAAVENSVDAHCFKNGVSTDMLYPEDLYANGQMQNEVEIEALEELTQRQWKLRLTQLPFEIERRNWRKQSLTNFTWFSAGSAIALDDAQRRANRRTGSKYFYITPEMKMLAHQRGLIRTLKRKPCNPNITYLGTN